VAARLTITFFAKPEAIAQREQHVGAGIVGQVLGLRAERELRIGPNTWQCASTAPAGGT
jgi:hypothetical protein